MHSRFSGVQLRGFAVAPLAGDGDDLVLLRRGGERGRDDVAVGSLHERRELRLEFRAEFFHRRDELGKVGVGMAAQRRVDFECGQAELGREIDLGDAPHGSERIGQQSVLPAELDALGVGGQVGEPEAGPARFGVVDAARLRGDGQGDRDGPVRGAAEVAFRRVAGIGVVCGSCATHGGFLVWSLFFATNDILDPGEDIFNGLIAENPVFKYSPHVIEEFGNFLIRLLWGRWLK